MPAMVLPSGLRPFVARAAGDVADDLDRIFGARPRIVPSAPPGGNAIVLAKSGNGWENYEIESRPGNVLAITGSDERGLMFGLYRFASDCLGVDPFRFWSGREPAKACERTWDSIRIRQRDPSFRFRGWFVNDEDFLNGFRPEENGRREIDYPRYQVCFGPPLMDAICETAVRAGFNTIICASYVDILNPDEKRLLDLASSRGLYLTTHHQEPLGAGARQLDLHFPELRGTTYATRPALWRKAWRSYAAEWAKVPDVIWQLGLRGRGDRPFWLEPDAPVSSAEARGRGARKESKDTSAALRLCVEEIADPDGIDRRHAAMISRAMREQLAIIEEALGRRPEHFAVQLWLEGAELYRRGLFDIPEGAIVIHSDNSPGLKFQPDIGGVNRLDPSRPHGLYYHLAVVHGNHRCELVPPSRTRQVLSDAWGKGARELLLVNVSNVRPFLHTLAAMGEMSRDLATFDDAAFRDRWAEERFGAAAAPAVVRAIELYFAAYETEPSRDGVSSYGSPRPRAPLAILHDGVLCKGARL
ncbi:MAG: glycosyl hydrolase 115 family protein, partial [Kiritimatiellae bacterium]|nr:glycosyl hydrolase 115 family protein [Kiritimatiellia bacterium]